MVRTTVEFDRAGVAAICIEDNLFPKRNSLYQGQAHRELVEGVRAGPPAPRGQGRPGVGDFMVIARVEALIAGHGVDAACERAAAYAEAGADAILIHSKDKTLSEIEAFLDQWRATGLTTPWSRYPTLFPDYTADQLTPRASRW